MNFQVQYWSQRGNGVSTQYEGPVVSGTNDWEPSFLDIDNAPYNYVFANVRCNNNGAGPNGAMGWYDDVALIEWNSWQSVDRMGGIDVPYPDGYRYAQVFIPNTVPWPDDTVTLNDTRQWPANTAPARAAHASR